MKKVLILYNKIWPYRIPIFSLLNQRYDLTVSYSYGDTFDEEVDFEVIHLPGKGLFSQFFIHDDNLHKVCSEYDVVVGYGEIRWLSLMKLLFKKNRSYKLAFWGIGVRASYNTSYGAKTKWDKVRFYLMKKADAFIFYSSQPIERYLKEGFKKEKLHVANNTVLVNDIDTSVSRESLLFIGTLYRQKQIYELLDSYKEAKNTNSSVPKLEIIGGGDEYENIQAWISENGFEKNVFLRGKIFDEAILAGFFSAAIACISPGQSGLSVLKSMGYGVPYISKQNAITGGEIFNIENGVSGVLYDNDSQLTNIILDITQNKEKYITMGKRAKEHYDNYRKPQDMADGISEAIEYVSNNSV